LIVRTIIIKETHMKKLNSYDVTYCVAHEKSGRGALRSLLSRFGAMLVAMLVILPVAQAQSPYPSHPVKLVVPFGAGGSADMLGRLLADRLGTALGKPVIVENRPGATGTVGATAVARSTPDGYTLLLVFDGTVGIAPVLRDDFPFNPIKDLAPVAKLADVELVIAANPSVPARNIMELQRYSVANPDKLSYASPGLGSTAQMAGELLRLQAGINWVHIPYGASGSGKFVVDVIGGNVPIAIISVAVAAPFIVSNKLVGIGVPSAQRNAAIPDVPTFREAGLTGFDVASWFGLAAPGGTPKNIIDILNRETKVILSDPTVVERLQKAGMSPSWSTPAALGQLIQDDLKKWGAVAKSTKGKI
jgi:tripartite-type tricarboxylate transporter receptor subunit TctC